MLFRNNIWSKKEKCKELGISYSRRLSVANSTNISNYTNSNILQFQSYLNLNNDMDLNSFKKEVEKSACVLYDDNYNLNATACKSWYDYNARVVLCDCSVPGLVVNLYDLKLTSLSRVSQFSKPGFSYCKLLY